MSDLKPCPWEKISGTHDSLCVTRKAHYGYRVLCGCGAEGPPRDTSEAAISAWNSRHDNSAAEIRYDEHGEIDEVVGGIGIAERADDDFVSMWIGDSLFRLVAWDDEIKWDLVERGPNSKEVYAGTGGGGDE